MKKTVVIDVDKDLCNTIEMYDYEYKCRKDIIAHLIDSGIGIDNPSLEAYMKKAEESYKSFELAKQVIQEKYINPDYPDAINWNLTYHTGKLAITVPDHLEE